MFRDGLCYGVVLRWMWVGGECVCVCGGGGGWGGVGGGGGECGKVVNVKVWGGDECECGKWSILKSSILRDNQLLEMVS